MFEQRWYQQEAEFSIYEYFRQGNQGNPLCALPTGTGKSVVIANFVRNVLYQWPNQRFLILTHVKELIQQNANKLQELWPTAPMGIYSSGLKSRDTIAPIVFGGVQSVAPAIRRAEADSNIPPNMRHFGWRDLVLIDEAHLLGPDEDTQYQYVIAELKKINPYLKVIGFTATPYRLKQGMLTDEGLFTDICYDITGYEAFNRLIAEGFLSPLIAKPTNAKVDTSEIGFQNGEFKQKDVEREADKITYEAVKETVENGWDRKSWLMFGAGVDNAEHITSILQSFGIDALAVHSKLPAAENDKRIKAFKNFELRALVNMNKLTTGFDHPPIDLIGDLQPTMSPGKHVQKGGRGTRPSRATGKLNCLYLDFGGNVKRLGPINDPIKPRKPGKGRNAEAPIRICDNCGFYNHAAARHCCNCGQEFKFETKLQETAYSGEILRSDLPVVEYFPVQRVIYNLHEKEGSPSSMKVSYFCGDNPLKTKMFNEWVCFEHGGMPGKKAKDWWLQRNYTEAPLTTAEALRRQCELRMPARLRVWTNKKFPEVLSYEF
jgi:DNA repair protein RadD